MQSPALTAPLPPNLARILNPQTRTKSLTITISGYADPEESDEEDSPCDCSACRSPSSSIGGTTFVPSSPAAPGWFGTGYARLAPAAKDGYAPACFEGGEEEYIVGTGYDTVVDEWVSTLSPVAEEELPRLERVLAFSPRVERASPVEERAGVVEEDEDTSEDGDGLLGATGEKIGVWGRLVGRFRRR